MGLAGGNSCFPYLLAWGHNFMPLTDFFLDHVPGYNKFRAVSMTLVIAELCIPLLALLALKEIISKPAIVKEKLNEFIIALGFTAGIWHWYFTLRPAYSSILLPARK
jgi:hypothetical protein